MDSPAQAASAPGATTPARVFRRLRALTDALTVNFPGPRVVKMAWVINLQKGGTLPFALGLMAWFGNGSVEAWTYAAMHGSYGLIWLLKDRYLPDPAWERRVSPGGAITMLVGVLLPYWLAPYLLISNVLGREGAPPAMLIGAAVFIYAIGVVLMIGADAQKYYTLRHRAGLITDGFFTHVRHPNYLGEMLLYASFALLVGHWLPWLVLGWVWGVLFAPNIAFKEARMARHAEWAAYRARTGLLWPRFTGTRPTA